MAKQQSFRCIFEVERAKMVTCPSCKKGKIVFEGIEEMPKGYSPSYSYDRETSKEKMYRCTNCHIGFTEEEFKFLQDKQK